MMNSFDRKKLADPLEQLRFTGIQRLLTQLEILETRIIDELGAAFLPSSGGNFLLWDVLRLDAETNYTVAFETLKLIKHFLPTEAAGSFGREPIYRVIVRLRNDLIRHALDKPTGDPYPGFGMGEDIGIALKAGTTRNDFRDPGTVANFAGLRELFQKYDVSISRRYQDRAELRPWSGLSNSEKTRQQG